MRTLENVNEPKYAATEALAYFTKLHECVKQMPMHMVSTRPTPFEWSISLFEPPDDCPPTSSDAWAFELMCAGYVVVASALDAQDFNQCYKTLGTLRTIATEFKCCPPNVATESNRDVSGPVSRSTANLTNSHELLRVAKRAPGVLSPYVVEVVRSLVRAMHARYLGKCSKFLHDRIPYLAYAIEELTYVCGAFPDVGQFAKYLNTTHTHLYGAFATHILYSPDDTTSETSPCTKDVSKLRDAKRAGLIAVEYAIICRDSNFRDKFMDSVVWKQFAKQSPSELTQIVVWFDCPATEVAFMQIEGTTVGALVGIARPTIDPGAPPHPLPLPLPQ